MGCQASRLLRNEDGQAAKASLFCRFVEAGCQRGADSGAKSTPSRKRLNEDDGSGDGNSSSKAEDKHVCHVPNGSTGKHAKARSLDGMTHLKMAGSSEEDEEKADERQDHLFGPRSPSFRVYCTENELKELNGNEAHVENTMMEKSERKEVTALPTPNKKSRRKVPKKRMRRKSFSLWSSSCYNPSLATSYHKARKEQDERATQ